VIEASGDLRPCFFHPAVRNIHRQTFTDIINGPEALRFRSVSMLRATRSVKDVSVHCIWSDQTNPRNDESYGQSAQHDSVFTA
jgi:iron-sulfur cluster protein